MPVDPNMVNPMLDPFRGMVAEVDSKGLTGPDVDQMKAMMNEMEMLAQQLNDIASYSGQLAQRGTFQKFSDAYGRALSNAAQASAASGEGTSDEELLANTLKAYKDTLAMYKSGQAGDDVKPLIPYVERMVALGESGISFPVYMRKLEEEGLNRVMEGAAPAARNALVKEVQWAERDWRPPHEIQARHQILQAFDRLAQAAPFGQPDPTQFAMERRAIEWDVEPSKWKWSETVRLWSMMLDDLVDWVDAHTKFAPWDERWRPPGASEAQVKRNIRRTKECRPSAFRYRERLLGWYFGINWEGMWSHETFIYEYSANRVEISDERLHLVRATYPLCVPGAVASPELIAEAERLHPELDYRPNRLQHPPPGTPLRRFPPA
jgi:hypothetical protein